MTYFQEQGRGSCWEGAKSTCILYGNLASYVYLMGQLSTRFNHDNNEDASADNEVNGFNSATSPWKSNMRLGSKKTYPLGPTSKCNLRTCSVTELQEVLRFFCLDLGCQHARGKAYLSMGLLDPNFVPNDDKCNDACSICTKKWHDQFLPVYQSAVVAFLEYLMQIG
jgi:hypothetical protein